MSRTQEDLGQSRNSFWKVEIFSETNERLEIRLSPTQKTPPLLKKNNKLKLKKFKNNMFKEK